MNDKTKEKTNDNLTTGCVINTRKKKNATEKSKENDFLSIISKEQKYDMEELTMENIEKLFMDDSKE